jgi:hypothetical protein
MGDDPTYDEFNIDEYGYNYPILHLRYWSGVLLFGVYLTTYCITAYLLWNVWKNQVIRTNIRYGLISIVLICTGGQITMNVAMYSKVPSITFALAFFVLQLSVMFTILLQLDILKLLTVLSTFLDVKKLNYCQYFVVLLWFTMIGGPQLFHMRNAGKEDLFLNGWTDFGNSYFPLIGVLYSIFNVIYCSILIKRAISIRKINPKIKEQSRNRYRHFLYLYAANICIIAVCYMMYLVVMLKHSLKLQLYWGTDTAIRNIGMNGVNLHLLFVALLYQKMLEATFPDRTLVLEYLETSNASSIALNIPKLDTLSRIRESVASFERSRFWRRMQPSTTRSLNPGTFLMPRMIESGPSVLSHQRDSQVENT